MQMGTVVEEEEQAGAIIAVQQSSSPSTSSTKANANAHGSSSNSSGGTSGGNIRSLQVSPPTSQSTGTGSGSGNNNTSAADHRDRHHHLQQQSSSSNSSFIPRRTRHRVDAGEPRGCFNNFYSSNSHSGTPFRFLYSPQQAQAQAEQHQHHHHQHSGGSSGGGPNPFLLSENPLISGSALRLYQQPPQQQHHNHRSAAAAAQHHAAAFSAAAAAAALAPHSHLNPHHTHTPHSHHQQQQQQLLFFEQQQREQQLKMLGELHHQQLLRDMLQKKAAPGIAATNNPANNNNNNTIMGLMSGKGGKSGYEEDCEEIARAREEIAEKNATRHGSVGVGVDNVNSNASSGVGSGGSADSVVSVASVNNNSGSGSSSTRINGCKKRKLYQPQRSDIDGKTPSAVGAGAGGSGSNAAEVVSNSGGPRSGCGSDDDEEELMMDEDYENDGENDMEDRESMPVETELGVGDDGDDDEYVKKEDEPNPAGSEEKVNRHGRLISEHNNNLQQGTKRVLRSQHRSQSQHHQQMQNNGNGSSGKHHNSDHSELLMNEISERKEKYGGLIMPQFKRASPNFLQQQQQLAPITRHLLQADSNNPNSRSSPLKQTHGLGAPGGLPAPIAQQQFQQLIQFRDSLKSTLIPHLNDFIDGQFSIFLQQQQQLFQQQLALQEQQRQAQEHLRRERPPSTNSHHEAGLLHQQQNVLLNGGGATSNGPRSLLVKSPGFPGSGFSHLKSAQQQAQQQAPQQAPHHQNLFTSALTGLYQHSRNNGLYLDEMDTDSPLSLVVTPKKKRHKVTDTRLTPRAVHRLLESGGGLHHRGGGVIGVDVDRPTYIPEEMSSPPPPSTVLPPHQLPSVLPTGGGPGSGLPNGGGPVNSLMDRTNSQLFSPSAAAAVAMYNAAILNGIQAQAQQQRSAESPIPATMLPTAVRDRGGVDRDREDRKRNNNNNGGNNANLEDYVQQLRELNNNSAGSADSQDTVGSYDLRECGSSYGGQSITSTAPIGGTSSTLTPMHLRKAKLMFFWVRYPSSAVLKMYFPDIRFNKNNTAQLVKWFSNFREFYYIQMEKYSRQAIAEGIKSPEEIIVTTDHELYRVLNLHYNRNNHIEVPTNFRFVVEQTLREFFKSVQVGKDSEQSWKKAIYKIIARLDDPVPEYFKSSNFLEQLE